MRTKIFVAWFGSALLGMGVGVTQASASDVPVRMVTRADLQSAANPDVHEAVLEAASGSVYFPDRVFAAAVDALDGDAGLLLESWSRTHRFLVVPFSIAVRPAGNLIPEQVDVTLSLGGPSDLASQPVLIDVFPPNGFRKAPFQGSAGLEVGAGGSFQEAATAKVNVAFSYSYTPAYANVISGKGSTSAFWQYRRTQDSYPIGDIPMKLLVIVPRTFADRELIGDFDVSVNFGGNFWSGGR